MASVELVWDMDVKMEAMYAMYGVRSHALNWYGKWEVEALPYPIPAYMADVIMKPCTSSGTVTVWGPLARACPTRLPVGARQAIMAPIASISDAFISSHRHRRDLLTC